MTLFDDGFADLTMLSLSKRLQCSLRTLYALAPSRDELMLVVVEHYLDEAMRAAGDSISAEMGALQALETYLYQARSRLNTASEKFARDLGVVRGVELFVRSHLDYRFQIIQALLGLAVERGEMPSADAGALAHVLSELAWTFTRPEVRARLQSSPRDAHNLLVNVIAAGLRSRNARSDAVRRRAS